MLAVSLSGPQPMVEDLQATPLTQAVGPSPLRSRVAEFEEGGDLSNRGIARSLVAELEAGVTQLGADL